MTEATVFDLLLGEKSDFPALDRTSAAKISKKLTDIIYDSIQSKQSAASEKRLTIFASSSNKFIRSTVANSDECLQIDAGNFPILLKSLRNIHLNDEIDPNFKLLKHNIEKELEENDPEDLPNRINDYNRRKLANYEVRRVKLEKISKYDQEFNPELTQDVKIIKSSTICNLKLLQTVKQVSGGSLSVKCEEYRHQQVQLAYALLNLAKFDDLSCIFSNIKSYREINEDEKNFLVYLCQNCNDCDTLSYVLDNFRFAIEAILIKLCSELISIDSKSVSLFCSNNNLVLILKKLCKINPIVYNARAKHIVYNLYRISDCNSNIGRFCKYLKENSEIV